MRALLAIFLFCAARTQATTEFSLIPAGSFQMGDSFGEGESNESPTHMVQLSAFFMAKREVTKTLWDSVSTWGETHGYIGLSALAKGSDHPAHYVDWYDAVEWCNARSEMEGLQPCYYTDHTLSVVARSISASITSAMVKWDATGYRLPTEAEWERAARGGLENKRFPWGDIINHSWANYSNGGWPYESPKSQGRHPSYNYGNTPYTSPGGSFQANGFGLYDMSGNVREWCWDRYSSTYYGISPGTDPRGPTTGDGSTRVVRSGAWNGNANVNRNTYRIGYGTIYSSDTFGFRLARAYHGESPPTVVTLPATEISATAATLNGRINPNGLATTALFEYGLTESYGNVIPVTLSPDSGKTDTPVSIGITGLQPKTTYHFRLVAENSVGIGTGEDLTFTASPNIIIFIPGIAGSVLKEQTSFPEHRIQRWPPRLGPGFMAADLEALNLRTNSTANIQAVDLVRDFWDVVPGSLAEANIVYRPFIQHLVEERGYKEFRFDEDRSRFGSSYMGDYAAAHPDEPRPTFFPFPYDWRKSNASHREELRAYIENISALHGGAKVSFVTHSMGGLVLRSYLLKYGTDKVDKVATIACPFWGAPVAVYRMFTGEFFDLPAIDYIATTTMKNALVTLPGAQELLPPDLYLRNNGAPVLTEDGHDLDGNGGAHESYGIDYFYDVVNQQIRNIELADNPSLPVDVPYANNAAFHSRRQDDSSGDPGHDPPITNPTLHLYGWQWEDKTPVEIIARTKSSWREIGGVRLTSPKSVAFFERKKGPGDETVPILSAKRKPEFNRSGTRLKYVRGGDDANHNGLMKNPTVWSHVDAFFETGVLPPEDPDSLLASEASTTAINRKHILILGAGYVKVTDALGNANTRFNEGAAAKIPNVNIYYGGDQNWVIIECAGDKQLTIESDSASDSLEFQITELGADGIAHALRRYRFAPDAAAWQLTATFTSDTVLKWDADQSGTFGVNETVTPSHNITGGTVDNDEPQVSLQLSFGGGEIAVVLTGHDGTHPTPNLFYSMNDAVVQPYTTPLQFAVTSAAQLKVYAEDLAGNTSGLIETTVNPRVSVNRQPAGSVNLSWPVADAFRLEESATLAPGSWTPSSAAVTRNGFTDSATISPATPGTPKFFRLHSRTVTK